MYLNGMDEEYLIRGLTRAMDMLVDDQVCSVVIIGVHSDGRGFKSWCGGDERVADQVKAKLINSLPLTPSLPPHQKEEDDGA